MIELGDAQMVKELILKTLEDTPRQQKKARRRLQEYAFSSPANFAEVVTSIAKFIEKKRKEGMDLITRLVEHAPANIAESRDLRVGEAVARVFAILAIQKKAEDSMVEPLNKFLSGFRKEEENEIFFVFHHGVLEPGIPYPVVREREDQSIFSILSNMEGGEYGLSLIPESGQSIFASIEDLERNFNLPWEEKLKIEREALRLTSLAKEAWWQIGNEKRWGIRPRGRDIIAIVDEEEVKDPLRKLNIKYLRFIQEVARPPGVGIEVIFENKRILLAKLNQEGELLVPWWRIYPEAALLLNTASILYLRDLTCGKEDTFIKLQAPRKKGAERLPSSPREPRECLLPRQIVERIPRENLGRYLGLSSPEERIRRISRKPLDLRYRRGHRRRLPPGWQASQVAKEKAKEMGYELLADETYVREFVKEEVPEEKVRPEKILRDLSAARELSQILKS